jgi:streptogramin lyase
MRSAKAAVLVVAMLALAVPAAAAQATSLLKPRYLVGTATRSINPDPDGTFAGKPVYLGGYGIGGGSPVFEGRPATGILGNGISVRAFTVSDGQVPFAIADIEAQGWFVAIKNGPYGLLDMRKQVEQRTGGALPAENVVIQTDHTHSGPDPIGVWAGCRTSTCVT